MTKITGNTYPVKDAIKALGGRWNPDQKCWAVPDDKAEAARKLVVDAPARASRKSSNNGYSSQGRGVCAHCGDSCNPRYRTCLECSHGGMSFTDRNGNFVLGSDD